MGMPHVKVMDATTSRQEAGGKRHVSEEESGLLWCAHQIKPLEALLL